jgi:hypothetical protein
MQQLDRNLSVAPSAQWAPPANQLGLLGGSGAGTNRHEHSQTSPILAASLSNPPPYVLAGVAWRLGFIGRVTILWQTYPSDDNTFHETIVTMYGLFVLGALTRTHTR